MRHSVLETAVSVVVPVYGNEESLGPLYQRLMRTLDPRFGRRFEVVFVDDASPEGSLKRLRDITRRDDRVVVVALEANVGQQRAVLAGLSVAAGRRVVVMDADLQDRPEDIPSILAPLDDGHAAVFASRTGRYASVGRSITSGVFRRLRGLADGVPAGAGLFVAMDRRMVDHLLDVSAGRPYLVSAIGRSGLPYTEVPVVRSSRPHGVSAYSSWDRLRLGFGSLAASLSWRLGRRIADGEAGGRGAEVRELIGRRFEDSRPDDSGEPRGTREERGDGATR